MTTPSDKDREVKPLNCDRDPARWAREFNEVLAARGIQPLDPGWLISWFANAMMCGEDTYRWRKEAEARAAVPDSGALEKVLRLADELCDAVDNEADDIGGSRPSLEIVRDLAAAVDAAKAVSGCGTNAAPIGYAVRMADGPFVGIWQDRVEAERICAKQPPGHGDKVVPVYAAPVSTRGETFDYKGKYEELIFAVATKWPNETRHQTALRYIQAAEKGGTSHPQQCEIRDCQMGDVCFKPESCKTRTFTVSATQERKDV